MVDRSWININQTRPDQENASFSFFRGGTKMKHTKQATTVVQATPFAPRRALEQPIRPGAVITLGQATASVGLADRQTVGLPLASRSQPL